MTEIRPRVAHRGSFIMVDKGLRMRAEKVMNAPTPKMQAPLPSAERAGRPFRLSLQRIALPSLGAAAGWRPWGGAEARRRSDRRR